MSPACPNDMWLPSHDVLSRPQSRLLAAVTVLMKRHMHDDTADVMLILQMGSFEGVAEAL